MRRREVATEREARCPLLELATLYAEVGSEASASSSAVANLIFG
jgi:hypothetical protein